MLFVFIIVNIYWKLLVNLEYLPCVMRLFLDLDLAVEKKIFEVIEEGSGEEIIEEGSGVEEEMDIEEMKEKIAIMVEILKEAKKKLRQALMKRKEKKKAEREAKRAANKLKRKNKKEQRKKNKKGGKKMGGNKKKDMSMGGTHNGH